jgi:hypothetical protein
VRGAPEGALVVLARTEWLRGAGASRNAVLAFREKLAAASEAVATWLGDSSAEEPCHARGGLYTGADALAERDEGFECMLQEQQL